MNEERQNAYLSLIDRLLKCTSGEETQILNANLDLVDVGLVEAMVQVIEDLEERGDRNTANFLINLAHQLLEALELSSSTPTSSGLSNPDPQLTFLIQVLLVTTVNPNPQVLYPLLEKNLDKLNNNFTTLLGTWVNTTPPNIGESAEAKNIALVIGDLSALIQQFPLGNRATNLEIAIASNKIATTFLTREASPEKWATLQYNLGIAYSDRILGKKADNVEKAIDCFNQALLVYTSNAFPTDWSDIQNYLGTAYCYRIKGEIADHLEQAINYYHQALLIHTRDAFPEQWAVIQNNLGNAYNKRLLGERATNLEKAISYYQQALLVRTYENFPKQWAITQNNLAAAYLCRILGDKADNVKKAINYFNQALLVHNRDTSPERWADNQHNLGSAYSKRPISDMADNLEEAINDKADDLEMSFNCFNLALLVFTRDAFPEQWAKTQHNVGYAYNARLLGERADNVEKAISYYQQALLVFTCDAFPEQWAITKNNLGNAYRNLSGIPGNRSGENLLNKAIKCYTEALQIRTCEAVPEGYAQTKFNLGLAYQKDNQLQLAHNTFADAINTVESLRGEIVSGDEAKQKLAEEWNNLYQHMVEVCLTLDNHTEAIEYAERSKTRNLVELIFTRDTNTVFPPEIVSQLKKLRDEISSGQYQLQTATADNSKVLAQHLHQLRKQRNQLQDSYMPIGYGFNFEKFQETVDDRTAIIEWYITNEQILTFIITRQSPGIKVWSSTPADLQALIVKSDEYLHDLSQNRPHWQKQLPNRLKTLAEILHLDEILTLIPETCNQLILIPHRFLHLFPLHALPLADGTYLLDCDRCRAGLRYAPSCQLLQLTQKQKRSDFSRLFAIQDPEQNLLFANSVVETIRHYFPENPQIIVGEEATKETLNNAINADFLRLAHCLLFSGHGVFNYEFPLQSCLKLANNTRLTLSEIFSMNLSQCSLVTLSACETGLADPTSISDEYISLPSGFLFAGTPRVVCSLWEVSSISTTLLIREFYKNLFDNFRNHQSLDFVLALNKAQKWLRELTSEQCEAIVRDEIEPQVEEIIKQLPGKRRRYQASLDAAFKGIRDRQPHPFASPYYWAAFTVTGS